MLVVEKEVSHRLSRHRYGYQEVHAIRLLIETMGKEMRDIVGSSRERLQES